MIFNLYLLQLFCLDSHNNPTALESQSGVKAMKNNTLKIRIFDIVRQK